MSVSVISRPNHIRGVDGKSTRNLSFYYFILATCAKSKAQKGFLFLFVHIYLIIRVHLGQFGRPDIKLIFPNDQYKIRFKKFQARI